MKKAELKWQEASASFENNLPGVHVKQCSKFGKKPRSKVGNRQSGMTLIEIMIALLIGVFLIGGVIQIFLSTKKSYRTQESLSRIQENGRFALELMDHDIRLAGYLGCSPATTTNPVVIANSPLVAPVAHAGIPAVVAAHTITGGDDKTSFASPNPATSSSPLATSVTQTTDAVTVQFGESCGGYTTAAMTNVNPTLVIPATNTCGIVTGTPLIISDCDTAHIFRAAAATDNSQNKDATGSATAVFPAGKSYAAGSEIMLFRSYTYFIQPGTGGLPSLWRLDNNKAVAASTNPVELIEGVENMQILYGVDTDADGVANNYLAGTTANIPATDWDKVVSMRTFLLLQSAEDNVTDKPVPYYYVASAAQTPTDRRLRKVFSSTVALRN